MIEDLLGLPTHIRQRLVSALETGALPPSCPAAFLASVLGTREGIEEVAGALRELETMGVAGPAAGAWLRTLEKAVLRTPRPDLVWSGPEVPGVHARNTRCVVEELLGTAELSVWASTYAYFDGPKAFEVLARRMEERPELKVTLLLNIQRKWGDTTAADYLVQKFAERFWTKEWPGALRPRVFYDPRSLELEGAAGGLHAKALIVDEEAVFVTSANPHRGRPRPQHRDGIIGTRPRAGAERFEPLPRPDRPGVAAAAAHGMSACHEKRPVIGFPSSRAPGSRGMRPRPAPRALRSTLSFSRPEARTS